MISVAQMGNSIFHAGYIYGQKTYNESNKEDAGYLKVIQHM